MPLSRLQRLPLLVNRSSLTSCKLCSVRLKSSDIEPGAKIIDRKEKTSRSYFNAETAKSDEDRERPIQFTTSAAHKARSEKLGLGSLGKKSVSYSDRPKHEQTIVVLSMFIFFVYFFILREESDVDDILYGGETTLYDKVPGLEKSELLSKISYYEKVGRDPTALYTQLVELEAREKAKATN